MITIDALRVRDGERTPLDGVTMLLTAHRKVCRRIHRSYVR